MLTRFLASGLPQILTIIVATAVPFWFWGYKVGYARATEAIYGSDALQDSVATAVATSNSLDGKP
jgi:hypothetical protein